MAKPLRARFQFPGGQKVVSVPADATFQALLALAQVLALTSGYL